MSTADFDLPAYVPFSTATSRDRAVAQLIYLWSTRQRLSG